MSKSLFKNIAILITSLFCGYLYSFHHIFYPSLVPLFFSFYLSGDEKIRHWIWFPFFLNPFLEIIRVLKDNLLFSVAGSLFWAFIVAFIYFLIFWPKKRLQRLGLVVILFIISHLNLWWINYITYHSPFLGIAEAVSFFRADFTQSSKYHNIQKEFTLNDHRTLKREIEESLKSDKEIIVLPESLIKEEYREFYTDLFEQETILSDKVIYFNGLEKQPEGYLTTHIYRTANGETINLYQSSVTVPIFMYDAFNFPVERHDSSYKNSNNKDVGLLICFEAFTGLLPRSLIKSDHVIIFANFAVAKNHRAKIKRYAEVYSRLFQKNIIISCNYKE